MRVDARRRVGAVQTIVDVSVTGMEPWEADALAELLDGCEPETTEQAHVLRMLAARVPMPSTRVRA